MAEIRPYTSQVLAQGQIGGRSASAADFGVDMRGLAQGVESLTHSVSKVQEDREVSDIQAKMAQARYDWTKTYTERQKEAAPGDMSFADRLRGEMGDYFDQMGTNVKTQRGREVFNRMSENLKTSFGDSAIGFQTSLAGAKAKQDALDRRNQNGSTIATDPSQYEAIKKEDEALIKGGAGMYGHLDRVQREALYKDNLSHYAWSKNYAEIERDPSGWLSRAGIDSATRKQNGAPVGAAPGSPGVLSSGFDTAIKFTLKHEGGYNKADSNGAEVNMGINAAYHPGVDVKNLTKQQATDIYRKQYWDWIGGDTVAAANPKLAVAAFDMAVLNKEKAKEFLAKSNGDFETFMGMRERFLNGLVMSNPEKYAKYANTWARRNADLRGVDAPTSPLPPTMDDSTLQTAKQRDPSLADLSPEKFFSLANHAVQRQNQVMAAEREKLNTAVTDARATLKLGQDADVPYAQFKAALGPMADSAYREFQQDRAVLPWIQGLGKMTGTEIIDEVKRAKPTGGEGAVADAKRYSWQVEAANAIIKERNERPAEYVLQQSSYALRTKDAMDRVLADAEASPEKKKMAVQAYAQTVIGEQRRLMMPVNLMTNDQEASFIASANQARGQDVASFMRSESGKWGEYWPTILQQVGKKLPPSAIVLGQAPEITDDVQAVLAEANRLGEKQWKVGLREGDEKAITAAVEKNLDSFWKTLQHKEGGQQTYASWTSQAELLAIGYVRQGMNINDATKMATEKLVNDVWDIRGSFRIPRQQNGKAINGNEVEDGSRAVLRNFNALPIATGPAPQGIRQDDWDTIQKSRIKNEMFWATSDGDQGLTLYRKVGTSAARVPSITGGSISYSWKELQDFSKAAKEEAIKAQQDMPLYYIGP